MRIVDLLSGRAACRPALSVIFTAALAAALALSPPANAEDGSVSRSSRGAETMPQLLKLAKTDPRARAYLYGYLLDHDVFFATEEIAGAEHLDPDRARIRVADDGAALIYSSERALFAAGEKAGWKRSQSGFPYTAARGQDAFLILFSNGFERAVLNRGDEEEFILEAADIEELSDGRIPEPVENGSGV